MLWPTRLLVCAFFVSASLASAADLRNAGEGDPQRRSSLAALEGKPAPALQITTWMNGKPATWADFKGKIVVLDFWATWCGPCIASIPHNNELAKTYADQGVVFIGVCHPRGGEKMAQTVKKYELGYVSALDPKGATIASYKVDGFPDYYIIDRQGVLRLADCRNDQVESVIKALLEEK